ncbi:MAG TPA: glycosyltransferase family 9 protein [Roseiflexaceae bacterium]
MTTVQRIPAEWQAAKRVLAVRLDNLGDVLVTTPAIHAIKQSLPGAAVTLLASPVGAQVGRLNPDLADVIVYQSPQMDPWNELPHDSAREQRTIALIKQRRFDGAIIFTSFRQSALPAAYLCYLADIPLRVAASIDGSGSLLTTRHKHPEGMMHEVERGLDLVGAIGLGTDELDLVLDVPAEARSTLQDILSQVAGHKSQLTATMQATTCDLRLATCDLRRPLVVVHPGCSMPARTYPWELYAEVVDLLVERLGATVALTGAASERDLVERIFRRVRPASRRAVLPLAGDLEFGQLCVLIEAADLTITNNTGPMHISAAVKTPVVALFALTNPPEQWGPWRVPHRLLNHDVPCRICYSRACPYSHECLRLVTPAMVVDAAADLLEHRQGDKETRRSKSGTSVSLSPGLLVSPSEAGAPT